jgi:hypothetical protein
MINSDEFLAEIDRITNEAMQASKIVIDCKNPGNGPILTSAIARFIKVNGYSTPEQFGKALQGICVKIKKKAMAMQNRIDALQRPLLLKLINARLKQFQGVVSKRAPSDGTTNSDIGFSGWEFTDPVIRINEEICNDAGVRTIIREHAFRYAFAWQRAFAGIVLRLNVLGIVVQYFKPEKPVVQEETEAKILLHSSVSRFAVLMRLMFECDFIGNTNKSQLCQLLSQYFKTDSSDTISVKSFRNHFDIPDTDGLAYWEEALQSLKSTIRELWVRYHSN